ncbi:MAG: response regulator transcription factor [Ferruginibacter sp.]
MSIPVRILIIGNDVIISERIASQLKSLNYDISDILSGREEVIQNVKESKPDIIILDIQFQGKLDAIEIAKEIKHCCAVPIIYIMAEPDNETFNRAMLTNPAAFISKPFKKLDLQRAIELAIFNNLKSELKNTDYSKLVESLILNDRIFIKFRDKMVKIMFSDILYIEADRNYSRIFTKRKEYLLCTTLKIIEEKLPKDLFIRIHRSYIINIAHVDEVGESYVMILEKPIPLSSILRENLLGHIQTL